MDSIHLDNYGVIGGTGYEFQHMALLHKILSSYKDKEDRDFEVYVEHLDDFVFKYNTPDIEIQTFQAKGRRGKWTINNLLAIKGSNSILGKIFKIGIILNDISYENFCLCFITNSAIENNKKVLADVDNIEVKYDSLEESVQNLIKQKIEGELRESNIPFPKFRFNCIDFPNTYASQRCQLIGFLEDIFGEEVAYKGAAIDALLLLLKSSALKYNCPTKDIFDTPKKITKTELYDKIKVVKAQAKLIQIWRERINEYSKKGGLQIAPMYRIEFQNELQNTIDCLKYNRAQEYHDVYDFVNDTFRKIEEYEDEKIINAIYLKYQEERKENYLTDIQIKAIIFVSYHLLINEWSL